ncbi:TrmH family RNA methyltransferase [Aquihabitans daechungensis]|uniref:TrmH family RNA methyltransferase n=1 Tax=Aquihabitans daechungensis TaxID=1052257 RepID=UPI003BA3DA1F
MRPLSARNPRIQRLTRLVKRRDERAEQRALVVEGPVLVHDALDAGLDVLDVYLDEAAAGRPAVVALLDRLPAETDVWSLPAGVLDRVGDVTTSQGVLAVVAQRESAWPVPDEAPFVLVLADLQIPGNVGTLIRAATAAGAGAVVVAGGVDPTNPKVVRSSAGALFAIDVVTAPSVAEALEQLRSSGYRIAATVVEGGEPYDRTDLTGPVALVLGSEAHGISEDARAEADLLVTIPMAGPAESLNVAMAGTVLCFEVLRQVRSQGADPSGRDASAPGKVPPP